MRLPRIGVVLAMLAFPLLGVSGPTETYADDFSDGTYSGNDGSLDFAGPWVEIGDSGSAGSGPVHVGEEWCSNNECLHIESDGLLVGSLGVHRNADLSEFAEATLYFDVKIVVDDPLKLNTAQLLVQVIDSGGWKTVKTYPLTESYEGSKAIDVSASTGEMSGVRFIVPGLLGGSAANFVGGLTVDRVVFEGGFGEPTTTTSSTTSTSSTSTSTTSTTVKSTTSSSTSSTTSSSTTSTTRPAVALPDQESNQQPTSTTSTTTESTTTTTAPPIGFDRTPPPDSGLREAGSGVMADYESGAMGDMSTGMVEVLGVGVSADFSMAVEVFEAVRWWVAGLALVIVAATIGLVDRRRAEKRARHRA